MRLDEYGRIVLEVVVSPEGAARLAYLALRHTAAAELRWSQYDAITEPLGRINLGETGVPRAVPVHATLAKLLAQWRLCGWVEH